MVTLNLAAISADALLSGVTVLSVGVLLLAVVALLRELAARRAMRRHAIELSAAVSRSIRERELDIHAWIRRVDDLRHQLSGSREGAEERLDYVRSGLKEMKAVTDRLTDVHRAAVDMSVDELEFVSAGQEDDLAALLMLFRAQQQLDVALAASQRTWRM